MRALLLSSLLAALLVTSAVQANRVLTITNLQNCPEFLDDVVVLLGPITYHTDPETNARDTVHGEIEVKRGGDNLTRILTMTLYKCPDPSSDEPCLSNPTVDVENITCHRVVNDDSGPWNLFSNAVQKMGSCGEDVGVFSLEYSTLKLQSIINYLDPHDTDFGRYRLRMHYHSTQTNSVRFCMDMDFKFQG